jgi:serine protease Do
MRMASVRTAVAAGALLAGGMALAFAVGRDPVGPGPAADTPPAAVLPPAALPAAPETVPRNATEVRLSFAPVARAAQPAVVNIFTARVVGNRVVRNPMTRAFESLPRVENSLGSGVIVDPKGLIVTNNHVIQGADQILVALPDRREYPARVVFAEPRMDLALLEVDPRGSKLPAIRFGDSDRAEVGDLVLAIGNPFGVGQTVTQGIVSAVARSGLGVSDSQFFLQTDAAINSGNSGGALVGMDGALIGINTAIYSQDGGSVGIGFAIPSNMVRKFLKSAGSGRVVTAWMGVEAEALTTETAEAAGLALPNGVLVSGVSPGSPAARAGLKPGDIIEAVDGKRVADPTTLRYRIAMLDVGSQVPLSVIRGGDRRAVLLEAAPPPETPARDLTRLGNGSILAGVAVANLSPALAQELGAGLPERGVVVVEVAAGAPARRLAAPRPGDILEAINGRPIRTVGDVGPALGESPGRTLFRVSRFGQRVECLFEAPASARCANAG